MIGMGSDRMMLRQVGPWAIQNEVGRNQGRMLGVGPCNECEHRWPLTPADDLKRRALEMAKTGRYYDCAEIETELVEDGFPEVYVVLVDLKLRAMINAHCEQSRRMPD